jgi:hypothetical protein
LEELLLGNSVIPWKSGDYLNGLTDLRFFKVYITNKYEATDSHLEIKDEDIAWSMFAKDHCPNLPILGIFDFSHEAKYHFTQHISEFSIRRSTAKNLNDVMALSRDLQLSTSERARSLSFDADNMAFLDSDFTFIDLRDIHALSLTSSYRTPAGRTQILNWIEGAPDLEQFSLFSEMP